MGLSHDLISEFVKITNDKQEKPKEGTVYATIVGSGDDKYVKIDGSNLLTPMDTTTDIEDGERVTVMIKNHKATVTGNITSPSVCSNTVNTVVGNAIEENFSVVDSQIENLEATVSSTYATKNEVKTLDDNIKGNYSTTEQMESAISLAKEEINLSVSTIARINPTDNALELGTSNLQTTIKSGENPKWYSSTYSGTYDIWTSKDCNSSSDSICRTWRYPNGMQVSVVKVHGIWKINTAWGSVYSSPLISGQSFNIAFSEAPKVTINAYNYNSSSVMVVQCSAPTTTATGAVYLWKPVAQTETKTWIEYIAIGRWK